MASGSSNELPVYKPRSIHNDSTHNSLFALDTLRTIDNDSSGEFPFVLDSPRQTKIAICQKPEGGLDPARGFLQTLDIRNKGGASGQRLRDLALV
jgi:hypothetical protein